MCAIAGVLGLGRDLTPDDRSDARTMLAALAHRGPDGSGFHDHRRATLGNARLRVMDLAERADLPMGLEEEGLWLAYNGETTNFRELAREHRFDLSTSSDSEVVLRLWGKLGAGAAEKLNGMFAFCALDERAEKAYLVRDPFGLRPLFYMQAGGRLYFASEIKAFLDLPAFRARLDRRGLWDFFTHAYIPGERTPFEQVKELEGGRLLEVDLESGAVREREYFRLRYEADPSLDEETAVRLTRAALERAVERNLASDAPLGLSLSGGVDSSGLVALAARRAPELHTFSIRMGEASFDETRYQRLMAREARSVHHEVRVGADEVRENLLAHAAFMDEPSGDGGNIPFFLLAKEASRHVRVLLSGEGGDEVFNAYETHRAFKARRAYRLLPSPARAALRAAAGVLPSSYGKLSFDFLAKRFTEGAELSAPAAHLFWRHPVSDANKERLLPGLRGFEPSSAAFEREFESLDFADGLDRLSWLDIRWYFIGDLMVKNDRMLMAHSVEGRYPYMDREVVELAGRIPAGLRLKGFEGRNIQKRALRGLVPDAILDRGNMGLEMPHSRWFLGPLRGLAEDYFSKARVERSGVLDHGEVRRLWSEHLSGRRDHGRGLWCVLNFLVWFDLFVDGGGWKRSLSRPAAAAVPAA
jgi:asparagine synthase (glutamine-hydrolysing)